MTSNHSKPKRVQAVTQIISSEGQELTDMFIPNKRTHPTQ